MNQEHERNLSQFHSDIFDKEMVEANWQAEPCPSDKDHLDYK